MTVVDFSHANMQMRRLGNESFITFLEMPQSPWAKYRWINVNGMIQALGKQKNMEIQSTNPRKMKIGEETMARRCPRNIVTITWSNGRSVPGSGLGQPGEELRRTVTDSSPGQGRAFLSASFSQAKSAGITLWFRALVTTPVGCRFEQLGPSCVPWRAGIRPGQWL